MILYVQYLTPYIHALVTCSHESEKKSLLKIDGEWNGVMNMRTPGSASEEQFVDVLALPTIRKKIQKLSAQDPGESRRRWIKVTRALAKGDEQEATDAKHEVCVCVYE